MNYRKILLLNSPYRRARVNVVFSAGLGYIAEKLSSSGFVYDVLDMSLGYGYQTLKEKISNFNPELIGFSMMSYRYKDTYALIKTIKQEYSKIDIVVGGPHISLLREKVFIDCPEVDFGVVLEGEQTITELCQGNSPKAIKGLIFRDNNRIRYNGDRPFVENLDAIPFPRYDKFELEKSIRKNVTALPVVSSRGCPFDCIYCPVACSIGQAFRVRSPENIMEELTYWQKKGYRRFSFADDNFTLIKDRVYNICELIKKSELKNLKLSCDNGIRADKVDKDLLKFMREVGFYRIAFGVEAGNNKILRNLKKREDIATIKERIKEACDLGYEVDLFFLVGSPQETEQDLEDSFKIALDYPIGIANFYNIIPFPNTELFSWIERNGRFLKNPDDYLNDYPILDNCPVFETPQMPKEIRKKVLNKAFAIMRKTMRKSWVKRLSKLGLLGRLLAIGYTTKFMQDIILRNNLMRKIIFKLAHICLARG